MKVRIKKAFVESVGPALNPGYVLDVPDVIGENWIRLGRAEKVVTPAQIERPSRLLHAIERPARVVAAVRGRAQGKGRGR